MKSNFKEYRIASGLSVADIAQRIGISTAGGYNYEPEEIKTISLPRAWKLVKIINQELKRKEITVHGKKSISIDDVWSD